jgi:hypothetical protein
LSAVKKQERQDYLRFNFIRLVNAGLGLSETKFEDAVGIQKQVKK